MQHFMCINLKDSNISHGKLLANDTILLSCIDQSTLTLAPIKYEIWT